MSIFQHAPITWTADTVINHDKLNVEIKEKMTDIDVGIAATILKSKLITATRDMTAASGNVSYTGVGFTPTSIHVMAAINDTFTTCTGFADSLKTVAAIYQYGADLSGCSNNFINAYSDTTKSQIAILASFDADGFTLTWTKASTPTGILLLKFLCFR